MTGNAAASSLDCREMLCPLPIYKTSVAIGRLAPGEVLEVVCTDPGSVADFAAFAARTGHRLLASEEGDGLYTFRLEKRAAG